MAAGCAVIAARVGGMVEIVESGVTGLLIAPNDVQALASVMARLLEDESLRIRLGTAARRSVRERFDRERIVSRIEQLYREA